MNYKILNWVEEYLFDPTPPQKFVSFLLLPLTLLYTIIVVTKRKFAKPKDFNIPIISVGNLIVGGSGKTPFTIALAKKLENVAIILRGYGRKSKGLYVVSDGKKIGLSPLTAGDEAILLSVSVPKAIVIVSEDRVIAIKKAKEMGVKIIILDDGFSKSNIKKFDILLKNEIEPKNRFTLPSGGYREPYSFYDKADLVLQEGEDFQREVNILNPTKKMLLVTAISKPKRLDKFLPKDVIKKIYFPDHYFFQKKEIENLMKRYRATSILTTQKDEVKMKNFGVNLSIMELNIKIDKKIKILDIEF